jgi:hypothetical protein
LILPERGDLADPIGQPVSAYRQCATQIAAAVKYHAARIQEEMGVSKKC